MGASRYKKIAVVIPCYNVKDFILPVLGRIGEEVRSIYVIDDVCPEQTGSFVKQNCSDPRVEVVFHKENTGVGGAVISGYRRAMADKADIIVKIDGDGQMDPCLLPLFVRPIIDGQADYTKGNRFFDREAIRGMPILRLIGNSGLSLINKFATGYWNIVDPTNGYTAVHRKVLERMPLSKLSESYFFESDMLFRLNIQRAVVRDVPINSKYGDEKSGLKISKVFSEFLYKNFRNSVKRVLYNYYLRDMSVASLELPIGLGCITFGAYVGLSTWWSNIDIAATTPAGTVMLAALPILSGLQLILAFISYDVSAIPKVVIHKQSPD